MNSKTLTHETISKRLGTIESQETEGPDLNVIKARESSRTRRTNIDWFA